jgi:hypothetical protein
LAWFIKKSKNAKMERAGERISQIIVRQKKHAFFQQKDIAKNARKRAMPEKKSRKGLNAKINANHLCQRKLLWNTPVWPCAGRQTG